MRQPLLLLALVCIAGLGAYRAFKYGSGARRFLGAVPLVLILVGCVIVPFVFGVIQGAGAQPQVGGAGGAELLIVVVFGSLVLAAISGAALSLMFRPPRP
jgi:hypothetical protein